jgi:O-antigen/teichoic acid export membrane protein
VFGKALHTLATQALGTLAALAVGVVLARVLGPSGRGVVSYAWLVLGLAAVYADGPAAAVVAQYAGDKVRRADVYRAMLRALPVLLVPATAGFALAALLLPGQLPLLAVACALPFAVYAQCVKGFFLAESRIQGANLIDLAAGAGYALLGSAVVLLGGGVGGALAAWVAAYAASALYGALRLHRAPPLARADAAGQPAALARAQLVFGGKSGLVYAAGYVNLRMGAFVVAALLGSAALGIYTIVIGVSELLWKISNALAWSAFGRIAGDDDAGARLLVGRLTRTIVLVELVLGVLVFAAGPWLIVHVYGAAFAGAGLPLRIMVLGVAAYAMEPVLGYFLLVRAKRPLLVLAIQLGSALLCAALAALAIPAYGLAGAAAATAASYAAVVVVKAFLVARTLRMPVLELFVPRSADARAVAGAALRFARRRSAAGAREAAA